MNPFDPARVDAQLTDSERNYVVAYIGALLSTSEEAYLSYRDEMLDEEYWATRAGVLLAALRSDTARQIYFDTRDAGFYTPDFVRWTDDALAKKYGEDSD